MEVVPSTTPAPTPPPVADWDRTCRLLEDNMPQNPTECDYLIRSMWCEEDCAVDFGILSSAHASIGRQPLSAADRHVLCNSPCYFTKYHDYLQRIDSSNCQRNLDASFAPPDPYVLRGYLPGNVPSQVSDLTRFAETICIYTEPTPEDDTDGYCLDIITTVGRESKVEEECTNIPIDTNFSTWQCPVRCTFALSRFFESAGCCLYNLEYPRYAMAGYPFFLKDLARACKITENVLALDQPCVGALASDCGTKSVCLGVSATGGYILSNGMRVGEGDSCLCTGANHDIQNVSGILSCVDKDECLLGESTCHQYATCINTLGSHHCQCNDGFEGDGRMCTAKPCGFFEEEKETCILCDEKCCNLNDIKFATYTQVVDIGCRLGTENVRDLYRRLVSSPSRFDEGTCVENVTASLVDCRGNESVLDMPCALWAKHDYFCTNLSYPTQYLADLEEEHRTEFAEYSDALAQVHAQMREIPYHANCSNGTLANGTNCTESNYTLPQAPTPPTRGWGQTQFWCLRNASGGMCGHNSSKVTRVVSEMDGVGIKAQAMCQADGTYNATIRCERISCGRYTAPASGLVEGDWVGPPQAVSPRDMFYPESVDIVCNVGYYATYDGARLSVGSPFLSSDCLSDSSYSVTPPRLACVPIVCGGFLDFIELTANVIIYREDSSMYPPNVTVCKSDEAEFCREDSQCCECLGRLRDCSSATSDGCRECNKCAGCIAITTVCPDVCANQALLPALVVDGHRSYSYGERVALECEEGYELSRVLKDTNISPLGEREPMCIANAVTLEPVFEIGMSCLAKP